MYVDGPERARNACAALAWDLPGTHGGLMERSRGIHTALRRN